MQPNCHVRQICYTRSIEARLVSRTALNFFSSRAGNCPGLLFARADDIEHHAVSTYVILTHDDEPTCPQRRRTEWDVKVGTGARLPFTPVPGRHSEARRGAKHAMAAAAFFSSYKSGQIWNLLQKATIGTPTRFNDPAVMTASDVPAASTGASPGEAGRDSISNSPDAKAIAGAPAAPEQAGEPIKKGYYVQVFADRRKFLLVLRPVPLTGKVDLDEGVVASFTREAKRSLRATIIARASSACRLCGASLGGKLL